MTIPQYAKSTDPEVLAAIERNDAGWLDFHERACTFAAEHGSEGGAYYPNRFAGHHGIYAIAAKEQPTSGRWKRAPKAGWVPWKNNPLHDVMAAIEFREEPIPGLPTLVSRPGPDFGHYLFHPDPFIHDGTAWLGLPWQPVDDGGPGNDSPEVPGGNWVEVRASEYHAAREAREAARP